MHPDQAKKLKELEKENNRLKKLLAEVMLAPYVNRLDNILADGVGVASDIVTLLDNFGLDCKVLAASFKNTQQVVDCALSKCHAVTLPAEIFSMLIQHPLTDVAVNGFENDWKSYYGGKTILDL